MNRRDLMKRLAAFFAGVAFVRKAKAEPKIIQSAQRYGESVIGAARVRHAGLPHPSDLISAEYYSGFGFYTLWYPRQDGFDGVYFYMHVHPDSMDPYTLARARYLSDKPSPVMPYDEFVRKFQCDT